MTRTHLLFVLALFSAAKLWLRTADATDLRWLLWPVDLLVSGATGSYGTWVPASGYRHADLNVVIDASCAGGNFACITFLLLAYLLLRWRSAWWLIPVAALLAVPLTVLANTARILTLLRVGDAPGFVDAGVWHQGWGAFVYCCVLLLTGLVLHYRLPAPVGRHLQSS